MNAIEREERRQAIRRDAEKRTREILIEAGTNRQRPPGNVAALALLDVLVDRICMLENEIEKMKRKQRRGSS